MANTDIPQNEEDLSLETTVSEVERPIGEGKIDTLLTEPNYSIEELNELDLGLDDEQDDEPNLLLGNAVNTLLNYKTNNIGIEELTMMKNSVLGRLDRLKIDADKIIGENGVTLQKCFTGIERLN